MLPAKGRLKLAAGMDEYTPEQPPEDPPEGTQGTLESGRKELRRLKRQLLLEKLAKRKPARGADTTEESKSDRRQK